MLEPEAWVAIAFVLFLGILVYLGAHRRVIDAIDQRQARIKAELEEATPAAGRGAGAARRISSASGTTPKVRPRPSSPAPMPKPSALPPRPRRGMEDFVARRTKMAETKIAQAEAQALADVRSSAADAAVAAAEKILSTPAKGKVADDLLARGIADLRKRFN